MTTPGQDPANRSEPPSYGAFAGGAPEQMPQTQRGPMPESVATAAKIMIAGAALNVVLALVSLVTIGSVRTTLDNQHKYSSAQINTAVTLVVVGAIIGGLIEAGLWLWMSWAVRKGHNWARIVSTVFFGLGVLFFLGGLTAKSPGWERAIGLLPVLVGLAAIIFLWKKESGPYFKPGRPQ